MSEEYPPAAVMNKSLKKKSVVLGDGKVYKIQRIRQRRILSCIPCHQRKIKCSRGDICEHCSENDLVCQYFVNDKMKNLKQKDEGDKIREAVENGVISNPDPMPTVTYPPEEPVFSSPELETTTESPVTPHTSVGTPTRLEAYKKTSSSTSTLTEQIHRIISQLPTRDRADLLIRVYQNWIDPLIPIIDLDSFLYNFSKFWNYESDRVESFGTEALSQFLWTYTAILFCSATALFESQLSHTNIDIVFEIETYHSLFQSLNKLSTLNLKRLDPLAFQTNVMVLSLSDLTMETTLLEVTKMIKLAQRSRLHEDPVIHHNATSKDLVQCKRMLWWQIFKLDDMVSSYHHLCSTISLEQFDTSLPAENATSQQAGDGSSSYVCFANSKFRYDLLQNELNRVSHGLNSSINDNDVNILKNKINDLYIFCYSSTITLQNMRKLTHDHSQKAFFFKYAEKLLSILADKILIKLQIRILATTDEPSLLMDKFYHTYLSHGTNNNFIDRSNNSGSQLRTEMANLNLQTNLNFVHYSYNDLSTNLLPSLLHILNEFIELLNPQAGLHVFQWELRNYLPVEELILLTKILTVNLKQNPTTHDIPLKAYLIEKNSQLLTLQRSSKSLTGDMTLKIFNSIWLAIKHKYNIIPPQEKPANIPQPSLSPSVQAFPFQEANRTTVSCFEIAPRTTRAQMYSNPTAFSLVDTEDTMAAAAQRYSLASKTSSTQQETLQSLYDAIDLELDSIDDSDDLEEHFKTLKAELRELYRLVII